MLIFCATSIDLSLVGVDRLMHTTVLWSLYRSTYVTWHAQLITGGYWRSKILLHACTCWWQL